MIAYKFLASGAVGPFTGKAWPSPRHRAPGPWLEAEPGDLARRGVHACRAEDLAWWPDEELWVVELGPPVVTATHHVAARRGRLLERVAAWNAETSREYAAACAWRAREVAVEALARAGLAADAAALAAPVELAALQAAATSIAGDAPRGEARGLAAYVAGAALRAQQGRHPEASLQAAHLAAALAGRDEAADEERAWQSRWLAERLRLRDAAARSGAGAGPAPAEGV